ncbi:MAG: MBOAT family O-acyltransferase [Sodaliphilus sp.]
MVFSDLFFLFVFLPAVMIFYLLASLIDRHIKSENGRCNIAKNMVLVIFSLIFYAWGEPIYVFLMLGCVMVNFIAGLVIDSAERHRKAALGFGLLCNLGILGVFKYLSFFTQIINDAHLGFQITDPQISLPIGISFYTFQSISYLIDVYRKQSPVQRHFGDLLLYISMFPQLIAGPIVRYGTVAKEIHDRKPTSADFSEGIYRFLIGLGKKVIIANQLSEISDQLLAGNIDHLSTAGSWLGIIAFTLQIYFDFSGYSDMAIGMGRCMGFHFNENFNHPYCCNSISDFWRRWHISLGSFFRDYVYIPLGGNRRHQMMNIFIVWFLTGMWHGASWNFIFWGVYFGVIVTLEKYTLLKVIHRIPAIFLHIYSIILVVIGWGLFYFDDTAKLSLFYQKLFSVGDCALSDFVTTNTLYGNVWLLAGAIILCMPLRSAVSRLWNKFTVNSPWLNSSVAFSAKVLLSIMLLVLSVALLVGATNNAFIYTRF